MRLLRMDKPQCLLYAAAMVLDATPETLIKEIGHDGMAVLWPGLPSPQCFQSFHMQEILDCFIRRGFGLTVIECEPAHAPNYQAAPHEPYTRPFDRFRNLITGRPGIMVGRSFGRPHAWAWDGSQCYDPNGLIQCLANYEIQEAWIKTSII